MPLIVVTLAVSLLAAGVQSQPSTKDVVDALRGLMQAKQWDELDKRVASITSDDPAWERLSSIVYSAGIARNDLPSVITRLQQVVETTTRPSNKAAALIVIGRVHRRQGDGATAVGVLKQAASAAPGSQYADEATGLIYEIEHLSPGLVAPAIDAKSREGKPLKLADLRGKAVVLVFWGAT